MTQEVFDHRLSASEHSIHALRDRVAVTEDRISMLIHDVKATDGKIDHLMTAVDEMQKAQSKGIKSSNTLLRIVLIALPIAQYIISHFGHG